jgi:hypothetical protein
MPAKILQGGPKTRRMALRRSKLIPKVLTSVKFKE